MKKYKDTVICCDIDGTLIDDNFKIPENNLCAIEEFRKNGGLFTLATGRTRAGAGLYLDIIKPDLPMVCQNGSAIYDVSAEKYLWCSYLDKKSYDVVEYVKNIFPNVGIEIMTDVDEYCVHENQGTRNHEIWEKFKFTKRSVENVEGGWLKVVFADEPPIIDKIQGILEKSEYYEQYKMVRSYATYYEFVNRKTNKAEAVKEFAKITGMNLDNLIVIGDNDNDCDMLAMPCRSFAPSSASENAKKCADTVLESSNNQGVLEEILQKI